MPDGAVTTRDETTGRSDIESLYSTKVLEFAANSPRIGRLKDPDGTATKHSRLCGSTITVDIKTDGTAITDYAYEVRACVIGQASSAILARAIVGATPAELREARRAMLTMLKEGGPPPTGRFAEAQYLEPVRDYRARHAATMLPFDAAVAALEEAMAQQPPEEPAKKDHG